MCCVSKQAEKYTHHDEAFLTPWYHISLLPQGTHLSVIRHHRLGAVMGEQRPFQRGAQRPLIRRRVGFRPVAAIVPGGDSSDGCLTKCTAAKRTIYRTKHVLCPGIKHPVTLIRGLLFRPVCRGALFSFQELHTVVGAQQAKNAWCDLAISPATQRDKTITNNGQFVITSPSVPSLKLHSLRVKKAPHGTKAMKNWSARTGRLQSFTCHAHDV